MALRQRVPDQEKGLTQCERKSSFKSPSSAHTSNADMINLSMLMKPKISISRFMARQEGNTMPVDRLPQTVEFEKFTENLGLSRKGITGSDKQPIIHK